MTKILKKLPTDPAVLKEMLEKLKDRETKLEADLAIREKPEIEQGIIEITLALSEVKIIDQSLKVADRPKTDNTEKIAGLKNMRKFYESKIAAIDDQLADLEAGADPKFLKTKENRIAAVEFLKTTIAGWADVFADMDVDIRELLPYLKEVFPAEAP